jgi:hypothetical protein
MVEDNSLFSENWVERFVNAWNSQATFKRQLKSIQPLRFVLLEGNRRINECILSWDKDGKIQAINFLEDICPEFLATKDAWNDFIFGKKSAVVSVMSGRIIYIGSFKFLIKHSRKFECIPSIAQKI